MKGLFSLLQKKVNLYLKELKFPLRKIAFLYFQIRNL